MRTTLILLILLAAGCGSQQSEPKVPTDILPPANEVWLERYDDCFDTQLAFNVRMLRELMAQMNARLTALEAPVDPNN